MTQRYSASEWKDDIKQMMLEGGRDGVQMVFLFNDTSMVQESSQVVSTQVVSTRVVVFLPWCRSLSTKTSATF